MPCKASKILIKKYRNIENAFEEFYSAWLPHELRARLDMFSLARIMHVCGHKRELESLEFRAKAASNKKDQTILSQKSQNGASFNLGKLRGADWKPKLRTEDPGAVTAWSPDGKWKLPGIISKPKGWPKDDGGRKAQTPRAGTVSAIDWNLRS